MKLSYQLDMAPASQWHIVSAGALARGNLPYVQEVGDFIAREKYFTSREGLNSYLIKYTLAGEGRLVYEEQDAFIPEGHFYWIDCRRPQYYQTSERTGNWRVLWVHFNGAACEPLYRRFLALNSGNDGALPADNRLAAHIYELIDLYREAPGPCADMRAAAILLDIMAACIGSAGSGINAAPPGYVRQAKDYMSAHFREPITLDVLAKELSLNKYYLQKLFTRHAGLSPGAYLANLRIARAKEMLRTTQLPVAAVAAEVGIETASHFIKLFRAHESMTPAEYRKVWRAKQS